MIKKISYKDKEDWENFLKNKEKIPNKDLVNKKNIRHEKITKIDLHGYTIEEANKAVEQFIQKCFDVNITKIIVITGKGLRSKNVENPYLSKDLSDNKTIEISDKDKQDWENFLKNKEKIPNKDFVNKKNIRFEKVKKIDLHGYTIEEANRAVEKFIQKCFDENVTKIIVITGKGLRSKNVNNPYLSKDLSILKYSLLEFIESNIGLTKMIIETTDAKIEDGGSGAFYIYLKNKFKIK